MFTFPSISNRQPQILTYGYNAALFGIFLLGYAGFFLLHKGWGMPSFGYGALCIFFPLVISSIVSIVIIEEYTGKALTLDKNIKKDLLMGAPLLNNSLEMKAYYYPAVRANYMPIFSSHLIMNQMVAIYTLIFAIVSIVILTISNSNNPTIVHLFYVDGSSLISSPILTICALALTCLFLSWLYGAALSMTALLKIKKARRLKKERYVEMQYPHAYLDFLITKLKEERSISFYYDRNVARSKTYDVMRKLANDGVDAALRLNKLIEAGYAEPAVMEHENSYNRAGN